jgi:hypothetical protein
MNILDLFAEKYLTNYDVESPVNNDIVTDGDCFFHALEYASGDGLQDRAIPLCINSIRKDLSDLYVEVIKKNRSHRTTVEKNRLIEQVKTFRNSKHYSEEEIIRMGIIYKKKAIIILKPRERIPDFLTLQIITNDDIGLHFNKDNVLFLIQEMDEVRQVGLHFKTFKNSLCRRVFPSENFIEKLNRDINNRRIFSYNGKNVDDNSIDFTCTIMGFDSTIPRDPHLRTRVATPHVSPTNSIKRIEEQFKQIGKKGTSMNRSSNNNISSMSSNSGVNLDKETPENERYFVKQTRKSSSSNSSANSSRRRYEKRTGLRVVNVGKGVAKKTARKPPPKKK